MRQSGRERFRLKAIPAYEVFFSRLILAEKPATFRDQL
jgi:hypothetical protein